MAVLVLSGGKVRTAKLRRTRLEGVVGRANDIRLATTEIFSRERCSRPGDTGSSRERVQGLIHGPPESSGSLMHLLMGAGCGAHADPIVSGPRDQLLRRVPC